MSLSPFGIDTGKSRPHHTTEPSQNYLVDDLIGDGMSINDRHYQPVAKHVLSSKKITWLMTGLVCCVALFVGRSAQLQIFQGAHYGNLADGNRVRTTITTPARGIIYDRHGTVLAENEPAFTFRMRMSDLPKDLDERKELFTKMASLSGLQPTDFDLALSTHVTRPDEWIVLKKDLPYETAIRLLIETESAPGFELSAGLKRSYQSTAPSLSHVLGYTGTISEEQQKQEQRIAYQSTDVLGKTGIEYSFETLLRGIPGNAVTEVNAAGRELSVVSKKEAVAGANLTLSIDLDLQSFIERRMKSSLAALGQRRGSAVVMSPKTGSVYALVSLPTFDNNAFSGGIETEVYQSLIEDPDKPLFNRAISGEFPSGSTFKPFVAYGALAEEIINERSSFLSNGGLRIGLWFFPDWKAGGHGVTDVRKAIADSVNTFFYIIGGGFDQTIGLGVERIVAYAQDFGFGSRTGIELPGEADGFLPSKQWKEDVKKERWYVGDTYHLAIGQGDFLTTPLQMAAATAMIANGGIPIKPHLVEAIDGGEGFPESVSVSTQRPVKHPEAIQVVREGMRQTVTRGSAQRLNSLPLAVAAKTGTAQAPGGQKNHAWTTAFGPYTDPEIVVVVLLEEGVESSAAVAVVEDIFHWWSTRKGENPR